ncbi:immunoglobulin-like domain-containing protein [Aminipila terrae]|uniref:Bacterial Ig-like domain-containing protein n=1 Tax=Aminipila terrae TaxID=2697030 RepID=A0A6P1MFL5_9FIRM|nr:immunoglobulin-like domain-containing protein [Aminipila terrae]QHI73490.1 hypothetical protein Ami3637_14875 [Aminipila terrae]
MLKKIITVIALIALSILLGILSLTVLPWATLFIGLQLAPAPPTPKITHGEFPFHLVYEIDGKQYTIDDTIICDYVGTGNDEAHGKYIKWDELLAAGNKITSFNYNTDDNQYGIELFDGFIKGQGGTSIVCDIGNPQYYLGYKKYIDYSPGRVSISSPLATGVISEDELWEKYSIKIIEEKFSDPMIGNEISTESDYEDVARFAAKGIIVDSEKSSYSPNTQQIVFTWKNTTTKQLICEQSFYIQKRVGNKWKDVYREKAVGFSQEEINLDPHTELKRIYDINIYTENIPLGNYRVVTPVLVPINEKTFDSKVICGEFEIK